MESRTAEQIKFKEFNRSNNSQFFQQVISHLNAVRVSGIQLLQDIHKLLSHPANSRIPKHQNQEKKKFTNHHKKATKITKKNMEK